MQLPYRRIVILILILTVIGLIALIALVLATNFNEVSSGYNRTASLKDIITPEILISLFTLITALGTIVTFYVKGVSFKTESDRKPINDLEDLQNAFSVLRDDVFKMLSNDKNVDSIKEDLSNLVERQVNRITEETIVKSITEKYHQDIIQNTKINLIEEEFYSVKRRINFETGRISRYAYVNLFIGFLTTFGVIVFLGLTLLSIETKEYDISKFVLHFVPRVSLGILIEIFAFFFLKLYSKNLDELKYWNNERTNLEMKIIAMKQAMLLEDETALAEIISNFTNTERNFVLKKGESTVELEKVKWSEQSNSNILTAITSILQKTNK